MYSSRNRPSNNEKQPDEERSFILPPINNQFETPRDSASARGKSKFAGIAQQVAYE